MRLLKVSPVLALVLASGCGGSQPPSSTPAGGGAPAGETAADKPDEATAPAGATAADKPAKAPAGGGAPAGATAAGEPARPPLEACNALLDHIQSVSSEAIDRDGMRKGCMNQWSETQINCFKAAGDDAGIEACWPARK